jgi:thioredoxin reductase
VRAFALLADEAEVLDGTGTGGPEPVRGAGVELGGFPGIEDEVVLAEHKAERAVEYVDPVIALVGPRVGFSIVVPGREEAGDKHAIGVRLNDDRIVEVDVVAVASRMVARADVFSGIGIEPTEHPMGSYIAADPAGRTAVPGVWVAGNATDLSAQVSAASADGARVAAQINADLVYEDTDRAVARLAKAEATR